MKRCPKCNRTYADDGFTFCLEDGGLLSAPYDPENKEEPVSTIQSGGPPPTAVIPGPQQSARLEPPAPTIASPAPGGMPEFSPNLEITSTKQKGKLKPIGIAIAIVLLLILGYAVFNSFYLRRLRSCPQIHIECLQALNSARCYLTDASSTAASEDGAVGPAISSLHPILALQEAVHRPAGVSNVRWSMSRGTITSSGPAEVFIDTTGFQQLVITVTAKFDRDSLVCPNEAHTLFVVGASKNSP